MPPGDDKIVAEQRANQEKFEKAVREMERHVKKNPDGSFELKAKNAKDAGVDDEAFEQLRRAMSAQCGGRGLTLTVPWTLWVSHISCG